MAGNDPEDGNRQHRPLNIEVTQKSFAWSYSYAEDLILFDYEIKNIGTQKLQNVYMGIYVDADVCANCDQAGFDDDICGFRLTQNRMYGNCEYEDTVYIAWIADSDGNVDAATPERPTPHVTATRIVRTPGDSLSVSFNWWVSNGTVSLDFGPRERSGVGAWKEDYRDFGFGGSGTPTGDRNKYYTLRNREFDYDQIYAASIQPTDSIWSSVPATLGRDVADGYDTRYLLSFGPFDISPGQKLPLSFSYLGGFNLHNDAANALTNLPDDPDAFYDGLDFSDLGTNATWASWIYDNPGVDTDGDDYFGKFRICVADSAGLDSIWVQGEGPGDSLWIYTEIDTLLADTIWYEGDGIPDFRGASPPPAPTIWVEPTQGQIRVRFNGLRSETTKDVFSGEDDFEGYRIYIGRDNRATSFSMIASYDIEDFNKYAFNPITNLWELRDAPFTLDDLRIIYNDTLFDPLSYTRTRPFSPAGFPDSQIYFEAQDYNVSELNQPGRIYKIYPDQPKPLNLIPEEADPDELTDDGYFKYYEYEFLIDDLLPTVPYYVNVTAFDYGSPKTGLGSLETAVSVGAKAAYPLPTSEQAAEENLDVIVYPNPYRKDGNYRSMGYEGRQRDDRPDNRVREIHFANLPPRCTIRIFTIDGDLVREIEHDVIATDPMSSHDSWDLITRNTQLVVSGLYYWTVESDDRETQVGKLAIIM